MHKYTIDEIEAIKRKANENIDNRFDSMGWDKKTPLSAGDVRTVLEVQQELSIKKQK